MTDVDVAIDIEFGQDVEVTGDRVDFRRDLRFGKRACDRIGLAKRAFDFDEKGLHRWARSAVGSRRQNAASGAARQTAGDGAVAYLPPARFTAMRCVTFSPAPPWLAPRTGSASIAS